MIKYDFRNDYSFGHYIDSDGTFKVAVAYNVRGDRAGVKQMHFCFPAPPKDEMIDELLQCIKLFIEKRGMLNAKTSAIIGTSLVNSSIW